MGRGDILFSSFVGLTNLGHVEDVRSVEYWDDASERDGVSDQIRLDLLIQRGVTSQ